MIEVRRLAREDIPEALEISLVELGDDYLDENDFIEAMDRPGQFCNMALVDGKVAGFAICQVFGPEGEPEMLMLPDCPERDEVLGQRMIGLLDSVAVGSAFKGMGVGTAMCGRCIEEMHDMGCTLACAMAWKSVITGITNIGGILTRMGFEETIAIQGYWNQMVDTPGGHHCPYCGSPCRCFGVFWKRSI